MSGRMSGRHSPDPRPHPSACGAWFHRSGAALPGAAGRPEPVDRRTGDRRGQNRRAGGPDPANQQVRTGVLGCPVPENGSESGGACIGRGTGRLGGPGGWSPVSRSWPGCRSSLPAGRPGLPVHQSWRPVSQCPVGGWAGSGLVSWRGASQVLAPGSPVPAPGRPGSGPWFSGSPVLARLVLRFSGAGLATAVLAGRWLVLGLARTRWRAPRSGRVEAWGAVRG